MGQAIKHPDEMESRRDLTSWSQELARLGQAHISRTLAQRERDHAENLLRVADRAFVARCTRPFWRVALDTLLLRGDS